MILHHPQRAHNNSRARRGYTLLEILLASLIAVFVLAAVYMLMNVTLQQTQASRDSVEVEDLSRGVFNKINIDLSGTLSPLPPKSGGNSAASGGGGTSASSSGTQSGMQTGMGSSTPTTGSSGTPTSSGSSTPTTSTPSTSTPTDGSTDASAAGATDNSTAVAADYAFQGGVIGDEKKLTVYAGRVPEVFGRYSNPEDQPRADQRQIIYWLGKSNSGGLYRRERPWITADGVRNAIDDDEQATDSTLLAEEVKDLQFEYFDGTSWTTTWDGTAPGTDGVTPLGPPRAIRITLTLQIPVSRGEPVTKSVQQVIAVRSAPGTYTPPLLQAAVDGGDNPVSDDSSSGSSSGGSSSSGNTGGNTGGNTSNSGSTPKSGGTTSSTPSSGNTKSGSPSGNTGGNTKTGSPGGNTGSNTKSGTTPGSGSGAKGGGKR